MKKKNLIHVVCGPTASGKSAHAMELARKQDGVIINCDSLQIYEGLPLLTAQPSDDDYESAPHLLYARLHPNDVCSAGNWCELSIPLITDILAAGQTPIICGGTGLYIKALTEGLSPIPDIPDDIRSAVVERYEFIGAAEFYKELQSRDPVMAARYHINHKARIIRAMEVIEATGKSLADWQDLPRSGPPANWEFAFTPIMPERDMLYERCNSRLLSMIDSGALEEVRQFGDRIDSGEVRPDIPLTKALGFHEFLRHLHGGISLEEALTLAQAQTRHYAKRQVTWFRHQIPGHFQ